MGVFSLMVAPILKLKDRQNKFPDLNGILKLFGVKAFFFKILEEHTGLCVNRKEEQLMNCHTC